MKNFTSKNQQVGKIGEDVACRFLVKRGFIIRERNYTQKYGEIDIIAERHGELRFVEVKTIVRKHLEDRSRDIGRYRPEENVDFIKYQKITKTIEMYLQERGIPEDVYWQVDVVAVLLDPNTKKARVNITKNVIL